MPNPCVKTYLIFLRKINKGSGFFALSKLDAINKTEEQLGKAKVTDEDPTQKNTRKVRKHLCKFRKQKKFTDKKYFEIYPSDPISPRLYGTVKAHKPEKNYPCVLLYHQLEHHPMKFLSI